LFTTINKGNRFRLQGNGCLFFSQKQAFVELNDHGASTDESGVWQEKLLFASIVLVMTQFCRKFIF
ncbi:hypothetical protein ACI3PL_03350, partial [Lacticaseibacillus paracasei]